MKRFIYSAALTALGSITLLGCNSGGTYSPPASDTGLAAYAGQAKYPYNMQAEEAPHLFAVVASDSNITIYNAGQEPISDFDLWINKTYTLHVTDKIGAHSSSTFTPGSFYNSTGQSLSGTPANNISSVEIYSKGMGNESSNGKLWAVQGPILPH